MLTSIELCAGAGGQALGVEQAGFEHVALVENDSHACNTLRTNRKHWNVFEGSIHDFDAYGYDGVTLVAGGVPCPPFSVAGHRLGADDERDLFPQALRVVREAKPKAVMLENVRGLQDREFDVYRNSVIEQLRGLGYLFADWKLLNASGFGVPQLRPRSVLVALLPLYAGYFEWPKPDPLTAPTVGDTLVGLMGLRGWKRADEWAEHAQGIAPTLVGGSKKHGGPDLGPTRARQAWAKLGVDGRGLADEPPALEFDGMPRLTVEMTARIQGFPESWTISGRKTPAYRQIGNAFPPPVALAVADAIATAIRLGDQADGDTVTRSKIAAQNVLPGAHWGKHSALVNCRTLRAESLNGQGGSVS